MTDETPDSLKGIELTKEAKKPVKEIEFIADEALAKEIDDPVRLAILQIIRKGIPDIHTTESIDKETGDKIIRQREVKRDALSVVEIVKLSSDIKDYEPVTKNQVYHHLPKLIEAGFIIKFGTKKTGDRTTDYYARTAKGFVVTSTTTAFDEKHLRIKSEEHIKNILTNFDIQMTEEEQKEFVELSYKLFMTQLDARGKISKMIKVDVADKKVLYMYDFLLEMYSLGSNEYVELYRKMRKLLFKEK